jgi:hypothetical protein
MPFVRFFSGTFCPPLKPLRGFFIAAVKTSHTTGTILVVGASLTAVYIAYVGDEDRFRKSAEVANYAGLTPALDCSGDTERYGHIQCGRWWALWSIVVQSAWEVSRSCGGGRLKEKFMALSGRMSKTKSAVAIARRIVGLMWVLAKCRELYADVFAGELARKFRYYKLAGWESWLQVS